MVTIYLVDYLGVHCGMHYYLEAFKKAISGIKDCNVRILSNYSDNDNKDAFFLNQYKGSKLQKLSALLKNLLRLKRFVSKHKDDVFVYLTYGNGIDLLFMKIISSARNHIIDIHEAIAQNVDSNIRLKGKFMQMYANRISCVISHSPRTDDFLNEYGYCREVLHVPHFKYVFPKDYQCEAISTDIKEAPDSEKVNLLFFGNLNVSKGVDILLEAVNLLDEDAAAKLNVIIAGKDFDGGVWKIKPKEGRVVKIFARHISDDELRYLYQTVDYLALPYRKTSQSGILEMAFYFKRPIIASDVTYFRKTLEEFPSFGVLSGNSAEEYAKTLAEVVASHGQREYFSDSDYSRYENRREVADFKLKLETWLDSRR